MAIQDPGQTSLCPLPSPRARAPRRDIKPDNFLLASEESGSVFLIDFGLSKRFRCDAACCVWGEVAAVAADPSPAAAATRARSCTCPSARARA